MLQYNIELILRTHFKKKFTDIFTQAINDGLIALF